MSLKQECAMHCLPLYSEKYVRAVYLQGFDAEQSQLGESIYTSLDGKLVIRNQNDLAVRFASSPMEGILKIMRILQKSDVRPLSVNEVEVLRMAKAVLENNDIGLTREDLCETGEEIAIKLYTTVDKYEAEFRERK